MQENADGSDRRDATTRAAPRSAYRRSCRATISRAVPGPPSSTLSSSSPASRPTATRMLVVPPEAPYFSALVTASVTIIPGRIPVWTGTEMLSISTSMRTCGPAHLRDPGERVEKVRQKRRKEVVSADLTGRGGPSVHEYANPPRGEPPCRLLRDYGGLQGKKALGGSHVVLHAVMNLAQEERTLPVSCLQREFDPLQIRLVLERAEYPCRNAPRIAPVLGPVVNPADLAVGSGDPVFKVERHRYRREEHELTGPVRRCYRVAVVTEELSLGGRYDRLILNKQNRRSFRTHARRVRTRSSPSKGPDRRLPAASSARPGRTT